MTEADKMKVAELEGRIKELEELLKGRASPVKLTETETKKIKKRK